VARLHRLYEQKKTAPDLEAVLGDYVRRWVRWIEGGLVVKENPRRSVVIHLLPAQYKCAPFPSQRLNISA